MTHPLGRSIWLAVLLGALGLGALYADPLRTGFLNDDYLFLEEARTRPLTESLTGLGALGNYYRPLSRQVYFEALTAVAGDDPAVFHAVNFGVFLVALALLFDLLRVILTPRGALVGCLYFALLPFQRVNLIWVSCSQDLMALAAALGALALFRRGRTAWALLAYLAAVASKESALPLPLVLGAWVVAVERQGWKRAAARVTPFLIVAVAWGAVILTMRTRHAAAARLHLDAEHFLAGCAHMVQSLLGLEDPPAMGWTLLQHGPALLPLILLAPLAVWLRRPAPHEQRGPRRISIAHAGFAVAWLVAFGLVTGPVAYSWSAYYYTLAAVGGAMLLGGLAGRAGPRAWLVLVTALLWWHAGATRTPSFAVADRPWGWTSHLTSFYFERAAAITDSLSRQLLRLEPAPPPDTRFFFATLPPWAGFQMGNGALIRALYRDPSLESFFYSQFSESTAADHPCRFIYWDGARLQPLYANAKSPFFQVGSDLLLLDRPAGAAHAFRRGLAAGEERMDHLYWLGWAELWQGDRAAAEATWLEFGARDDSLRWIAHLRAAHNTLVDEADTLNARRHLIRAIEYGMGRPEGHAVLGHLLTSSSPKYAMLELRVATWLNPRDWMARRDLVLGLVKGRLDEAARRQFEALDETYPEWRADSSVAGAWRTLERRSSQSLEVARF